jgi:hypothetical protein
MLSLAIAAAHRFQGREALLSDARFKRVQNVFRPALNVVQVEVDFDEKQYYC